MYITILNMSKFMFKNIKTISIFNSDVENVEKYKVFIKLIYII